MKDLYSFDATPARALAAYEEVRAAYARVLQRVGVRYVVADADTGAIGGTASHEFHIPADVGEDVILTCTHCAYAANSEKAIASLPDAHYAPNPPTATNLSDDNPITRHVRGLIPAGVRSDVSLKYEVVQGGDKDSETVLVLLASTRALNPVAVRLHLGWAAGEAVRGKAALQAVAEAMERKTPLRLLVDVSCVAREADLDVDEMDALESVLLHEKELTAEEVDNIDDVLAGFDLDSVRDAHGAPDDAAIMRRVEEMMEGAKGRDLLQRLKVRVDASGGIQVGEHLDAEDLRKREREKQEAKQARAAERRAEEEEMDSAVKQISEPRQGTFHLAQAGDRCAEPGCKGALKETRGIEVGHVFYLGTRYSAALSAQYRTSRGEMRPMEMGCYGMGVSRLMAAVVEVSHDKDGIVWPASIAPYQAVIIPIVLNPVALGPPSDAPSPRLASAASAASSDPVVATAERVYDQLSSSPYFAGELLLDDRVELRLGPRIKQSQLMGIPWLVIVGPTAAKEGVVEVEVRRTGEKRRVPIDALVATMEELRRSEDEAGRLRALGKDTAAAAQQSKRAEASV